MPGLHEVGGRAADIAGVNEGDLVTKGCDPGDHVLPGRMERADAVADAIGARGDELRGSQQRGVGMHDPRLTGKLVERRIVGMEREPDPARLRHRHHLIEEAVEMLPELVSGCSY